jgi:hypothetical protein
MRSSFYAGLAFAALSFAAAQRPVPQPAPAGPPRQSQLRNREVAVVIDGCVENRRLKLSRHSSTNPHEGALRATEYILEGTRELLAQLSTDHQGHHEEITGIAIIPPGGDVVDTRTKTIGGVRVTGAVRDGTRSKPAAQTPVIDSPRPVRIRVQAATHLAETCQPIN